MKTMKPWKLLNIVDQNCQLCHCSFSPMIHHSWKKNSRLITKMQVFVKFLIVDYNGFFNHVMVLEFLCKDHCCHHDAIIMFIVHWSSLWWCCAHCNCNRPSHLVVFCFYFGPFEVANCGVLWSDHCYHLGMILMWQLIEACRGGVVHITTITTHHNCFSPLKVMNSLLELVSCVLCFMQWMIHCHQDESSSPLAF